MEFNAPVILFFLVFGAILMCGSSRIEAISMAISLLRQTRKNACLMIPTSIYKWITHSRNYSCWWAQPVFMFRDHETLTLANFQNGHRKISGRAVSRMMQKNFAFKHFTVNGSRRASDLGMSGNLLMALVKHQKLKISLNEKF